MYIPIINVENETVEYHAQNKIMPSEAARLRKPCYMSRKVKHTKMENIDPRQVQTNRVTVIKLGKTNNVDHINKRFKFN
jgi:hypothetical protein